MTGPNSPRYDDTFLIFDYGDIPFDLFHVVDDAYAGLGTSDDTKIICDSDKCFDLNFGGD